jgi:hypothetical protein
MSQSRDRRGNSAGFGRRKGLGQSGPHTAVNAIDAGLTGWAPRPGRAEDHGARVAGVEPSEACRWFRSDSLRSRGNPLLPTGFARIGMAADLIGSHEAR